MRIIRLNPAGQRLLALCLAFCILPLYFGSSQAPAASVDSEPGVYRMDDGTLTAVGKARISSSLSGARAERAAEMRAELDAKRRLGEYLFASEVAKLKKYSISVQGARRLGKRISNDGSELFIAITAEPSRVAIAPYNPLDDCYDVRAAPLVGELLMLHPPLADGGGMVFDRDSGWVAIGVGFAALLPDAGEDALREARAVARLDAGRALSETVFGSQVSTRAQSGEIVATGSGGDKLREWAKNTVTEQVEGAFKNAQLAGEWKTDDAHLGVAIIVGRPEPDLGTGKADNPEDAGVFTAHRLDMPEEWQKVCARLPWIMEGGAAVIQNSNEFLLIVIESGKLQNNPVYDRTQLPVLVETKARTRAVRYLSGFSSSNTVLDSEEYNFDSATDSALATDVLHKVARENSTGVVAGLRKIGTWQSADEGTAFTAFAVPLPQ